jgi:phenylacetate-CoA ligase
MKYHYEFKTNRKVLYLLPTPSMKGGMTATTQMFYDVNLFAHPNIKHFDTMFKWGKSPIIRFFESPILKLKFIFTLIKYKPDAIYVIMSPYWGFYDKISYCLIAKLFGVKTVFNSVSGRFIKFYENNILNRYFVKHFIKIPDVVVLGSEFWINYFKQIRTDIYLHEIGNPVISNSFDIAKQTNHKIRVVTACRITKEKGIIELVEVIKKVTRVTDTFEFCILGEGPELAWMRTELNEQITKGQVELKGFITGEEKNKLIVNSDIYIMLTHFDMMPISILEAMAASLPVFSTKTGSIVDIIEEGKNGHLFEIGEVDKVVEQLLWYTNQKNTLELMGKRGQTLIKNKYDIAVIINKQLNLIESLFKNKMSIWDKLYKRAPVFIQNIGISLYGLKWKKRRFGGVFKEQFDAFKQREQFDAEKWNEFQTNALRDLLVHAFNHVPYYQDTFKKIGLGEHVLKNITIEDLKQIPILEKDTLRTQGTTTLLSNKLEKNGEFYSSSGSTGTPTKIRFSEKMHQRWSAVFEARIRNWAGLSIKNPRGMIGGRRVIPMADAKPPYYRFNSFEKQVYFSAYHINAQNALDYLEGMKKHHIDYMTGYAMSNYFLARFIEENNLNAPKLKAVITSSEKLTQEMRDTFARVYGCKTYDSYSGVEACGLISECEHGSLHMSPDVAIIEIIKENGEYAKPGETGEAVCTGFLNYDQPLIRYRIGDLIKLSKNQSCKCGRKMTMVEEITGRLEDTIIGKDGRKMVRFHGLFINLPNIIEGQIIQHTVYDFEINVVLSQALSANDENLIISRMKSQLGEVNVLIKQVDNIPKNQNGKFKAVISKLNN